MKKVIQGLLVGLLTVSSVAADSSKIANHTYLAANDSISHGFVVDNTVRNMRKSAGKDAIGGDLSIAGVYRRSHNSKAIARHFGGGTGAVNEAKDGSIEVAAGNATTSQSLRSYDIENAAASNTATGMMGRLKFDPVRTEYGAHVNYTQCLGTVVEGLSLQLDVPVVHVATDMRATYENNIPSKISGASSLGKTIQNYFEGDVVDNVGQNALAAAKVNRKGTELSETGVADIAVRLNYTLAKDVDYSVGLGVNALIPTGNVPKALNLFEPVVGNGGHVGLGGQAHGCATVWRSLDRQSALTLGFNAYYRYLLESKETRVLGMAKGGSVSPAGHFNLVAKLGDVKVTPAANLFKQELTITPGHHFDGVLSASFKHLNFAADLAYVLKAHGEETGDLVTKWANDKVIIFKADDKADGTAAINGSNAYAAVQDDKTATQGITGLAATQPIFNLDKKVALNEAALTHAVAAALSYTFDGKMPVRVGLGGMYDFDFSSSENDAVRSYSVWLKAGINF